MGKRRKFSPEMKAQIVLSLLSGAKSSAELCREYNVKSQLLSRWKTEFLEKASQVFENGQTSNEDQARIEQLERLVGRLTLENDVLKKASSMLRYR